MPDALIQLSRVTKRFSSGESAVEALAGIDLAVRHGEFLTISGPKSCGKSTLMALMGLLEPPTSGEFQFNGRDASRLGMSERARIRNHEVGFLFQTPNLIDDLTVCENVELPLKYQGVGGAERKARVKAMLEQLGVSRHTGQFPSELTLGQQQHVSLARALVTKPILLLADEPTAQLNGDDAASILAHITRFHQAGNTVCLITSQLLQTQKATRVIHLFEGRVVHERSFTAV